MCEGSIYEAHRTAKEQEKLVLRTIAGTGGLKGFYPAEPTGNKLHDCLVCVRGTKKMVIRKVNMITTRVHAEVVAKWQNKENVTVSFRHVNNSPDTIVFPDGNPVWLSSFHTSTRFDLGYPVDVAAKGMKAIKEALREQASTQPTPAPQPDGDKPKPGYEQPGQGENRPQPPEPKPETEQPRTPERARRRSGFFSRFIV